MAQLAADFNWILCDVNAQYPHYSTHVPGTVNVVWKTTCRSNQPEARAADIHMRVAIYRNGTKVDERSDNAADTNQAQENAADPTCHNNAFYKSWGAVEVWPPPGFYPSFSRISGFANGRHVQCRRGG